MEYEVLWGDGPLGLTLRPDLGEDMPPVVGRITRLDSAAALAKVSVGHMLVSINGIDTARQGYDHVVGMLQKISRPATLRFRVPRALAPPGLNSMSSRDGNMPGLPMAPGFRHQRSDHHRSSAVSSVSDPGHQRSSSREQYTVVWTEGPLGMILQPDKDDCHVPCIRKITGKGVGTGMERATVGDILVAVNGQETKSLGFRSTISLLKTIRKPAVLKFKRMRRTISRTPSYRDSADTASTRSIPTSFSNDPSVYDIVWREGDLGLKLKPGRHDVPVLSKLTGKGNASGLQFASIGDELVSVNGSPVEGEAYQDTLRMLKHSPKPAVLRFRRVRSRQSTDSIRSDPGFSRDLDSVRKPHVPVYAGSSSRSREPEPARRKKKKIPLDVAKELVSASLGMDGNSAVFAGMPIHMIEEGTEEAHLLRKEAK
uniref:PDZ domain-containing protein n=1 Tax=Globisporangium ultimum (strain ATCC 200006 / CBS 805.95 / DAOM BR144) TaxID=431595 RepID=K3WDQ0_GLOUD